MGIFDSTSTSSSKAAQSGAEAGAESNIAQASIDASGGGYANFQTSYVEDNKVIDQSRDQITDNSVQATGSYNTDNSDNSITDNSNVEQYDYSDNSVRNIDNSVRDDSVRNIDNSVSEQYDYSDNSVTTDASVRNIDNSVRDDSVRNIDNSITETITKTENVDNSSYTYTTTTTDFGAVGGALGVARDTVGELGGVVDRVIDTSERQLSESLAFGESAIGAVQDTSANALGSLVDAFDSLTDQLSDQQDDVFSFVGTQAQTQTERGIDSVINLSQTLFYLIAGVAGVYVVSRAIK